MATQTVTDALIWPQSQGTGLDSESRELDATLLSALAHYQGEGEYVNTDLLGGLSFINHDGANDTVDVDAGVCYVRDNSSATGGKRDGSGNPQGESTTSGGYDFSFADLLYVVVLPTSVTVDVSSATLNRVWLNITDVTSNTGNVEIRTDGGGGTTTQPSDTYLKLGKTNPDDSTADTRANDYASLALRNLTLQSGDVVPAFAGTRNIGTATKHFNEMHASTFTTHSPSPRKLADSLERVNEYATNYGSMSVGDMVADLVTVVEKQQHRIEELEAEVSGQ